MTDPVRPLREILAELQEVLEASPEIGEEGRSALRRVAGEIQTALEEGGSDAPAEGLGDQLSQALEQFEEEHPTLTHLVGRIADALSDLGI